MPKKEPPRYGVFKAGDPLKTGHNKCIGGRNGTTEEKYCEEVIPEKIFGQNFKKPLKPWVDVSGGKTMMNTSTVNHQRNINREIAYRGF